MLADCVFDAIAFQEITKSPDRVDAVNSTDLAPCGLVNIALFTATRWIQGLTLWGCGFGPDF